MTRGLVPDLGPKYNYSVTRSCGSLIPIDTDAQRMGVRTKQRNSLMHHGVLLYNCIPSDIRNTSETLNEFKSRLDEYLSTVPDHPAVPGLIPDAPDMDGNPSNCLLDWVKHLRRNPNMYPEFSEYYCSLK